MWHFFKSNGITEGFHWKMNLIQHRACGLSTTTDFGSLLSAADLLHSAIRNSSLPKLWCSPNFLTRAAEDCRK